MVLIVWNTGIVLAPIMAGSYLANSLFSKVLYFFYGPVCHQISDRSLYILNYPLAVCARCFSFYTTGLLICIFYLLKNTIVPWKYKYYIFFIIPLLLDFTLEKLGLYNDLVFIRLITGAMFGFVIFHLLIISVSHRIYLNTS